MALVSKFYVSKSILRLAKESTTWNEDNCMLLILRSVEQVER